MTVQSITQLHLTTHVFHPHENFGYSDGDTHNVQHLQHYNLTACELIMGDIRCICVYLPVSARKQIFEVT